jgi:hypothetical protein
MASQPFSITTAKEGALIRVGLDELKKARERVGLVLVEVSGEVQLGKDAVRAAIASEAAAQDEAQFAANELKALEADIDYLRALDTKESLAGDSLELFLVAANARLERSRERELEAILKLQMLRRHRELQEQSLKQSKSELARARENDRALAREMAVLQNWPERRAHSAGSLAGCDRSRPLAERTLPEVSES